MGGGPVSGITGKFVFRDKAKPITNKKITRIVDGFT